MGKISKTPVKVIKPDDICRVRRRVCRSSPAVLGRGKFSLFNAQSKEMKLADRLQAVLGQPVNKVAGVSSTICKCEEICKRWRNMKSTFKSWK